MYAGTPPLTELSPAAARVADVHFAHLIVRVEARQVNATTELLQSGSRLWLYTNSLFSTNDVPQGDASALQHYFAHHDLCLRAATAYDGETLRVGQYAVVGIPGLARPTYQLQGEIHRLEVITSHQD